MNLGGLFTQLANATTVTEATTIGATIASTISGQQTVSRKANIYIANFNAGASSVPPNVQEMQDAISGLDGMSDQLPSAAQAPLGQLNGLKYRLSDSNVQLTAWTAMTAISGSLVPHNIL